MFILSVNELALCGGAAGFLICTLLLVCVMITPVPVNTPEASLASDVEPVNCIAPSAAAVTLKVFAPDLNVFGGLGVLFASLKKNEPIISPQLSDTKSILVIFATAPLFSPIIMAPFTAYPKYFSSVANELTSILSNFDVAEYVFEGAGLEES